MPRPLTELESIAEEERQIDALESARNPRPLPERPPLMDALTFKVCTVCIEVDRILEGLEHGP